MNHKLFSLASGGALLEDEKVLENFLVPCQEAHRHIHEGASADKSGYGWYGLGDGDLEGITRLTASFSRITSVIQVGIGGSALGSLMLQRALAFNSSQKLPEFFVVDNVDPRDLFMLRQSVDPQSSLLVVVSKSGGTAETMANFLWIFAFFEEVLGRQAALKRTVVLTDPEKGILRDFVKETGALSLPVPSSVGGRFSVLSPVGLFGATLLDMPVGELLLGARQMRAVVETKSSSVLENPGWLWSVLSLLHQRQGRNMTVLMPYADGLESFAEWFAQLWGESLGKAGLGSTPIRALGAIDQHSQVQLYTEGPDDKLYTVLVVRQHPWDTAIPPPPASSLHTLAYLQGHFFGDMLYAEAQATASALIEKGRPLFWLELPELDARRLGALIFFFEYATAVTGMLMKVNPFDQPGVEQGKKNTYGLMGRPGYETSKEVVEKQQGRIFRLNTDISS